MEVIVHQVSTLRLGQVANGEKICKLNKREMSRKNLQVCDLVELGLWWVPMTKGCRRCVLA